MYSLPSPIVFTARCIRGAGRGKDMGIPTVNLELADVPFEMREGIYACESAADHGVFLPAALHYGPRPVHKDSKSCEVHFLDAQLSDPPASLTVRLIGYVREVQDFTTEAELIAEIHEDIRKIRLLLAENGSKSQ